MRSLSRLTDEFFSCLLQQAYPKNLYLFERRLHVEKQKYFIAMTKLNEPIPHLQEKEQVTMQTIEHLFDVLMDCMQLRRRVSDHTIFEVCANELTAISKAIQTMFSAILATLNGKKKLLDEEALKNAIKRLEENYLNVLQVTAKEPLVFLLFISSLTDLRKALVAYYERLP